MSLPSRIARPLLSLMFIVGGIDAVRNPEGKVKLADPVARPIAKKVPGLPEDTETLVRLNGAVQVVAGGLLAIGKFRRLAALALIGSVIPTTYAGHRFWEEADEETKRQQQAHFFKNLGLLGGLVLAATDTEGSPSLGWRAKHRTRGAGTAVANRKNAGAARARSGAARARSAADRARSGAARAKAEAVKTGAATAAQTSAKAGAAKGRAVEKARQAAERLPDVDVGKVLQKVS